MYVLLNLTVNTPIAEKWLASLRDDSGAAVRVQRFVRVGTAALDITPAQVEEGRGLKLAIYPVEAMRIPSIHATGRAVPLPGAPGFGAWNQALIGRSDFNATGAGIKV